MQDGTIFHYLDGNPINEPKGWFDFEEEFDRDIEARMITLKYGSDLTFTQGAYATLQGIQDQFGYCRTVIYEAKQVCGNTFTTCAKGLLILADASWDLTRCEVTIPLVDDGIGARIKNNETIPVSPAATQSKNEIAITPVPEITMTLVNPVTGVDLADTRRMWDWWEAVQHALAYMSDGAITATSAWYNALPDGERFALVDGWELRNHDQANTRVVWEWKDLFENMAVKYNLWIAALRQPDGSTALFIEPEETFYSANVGAQILNIQGLTRTIEEARLYAKAVVGSDVFKRDYTGADFELPYITLRTHSKEEFNFKGVCNTEAALEVSGGWIYDTNVIEDVLVNGVDDYDEDIFIIQYNRTTNKPTGWQLVQSVGTDFLYNEALLNETVLSRYNLPSPVGGVYANPGLWFEELFAPLASQTITPPATSTAAANMFTTVYTAAANEFVQFELLVRYAIVSNDPLRPFIFSPSLYLSGAITVLVERYTAANVLLSTQTFTDGFLMQQIGIGLYQFQVNPGTFLNATEYVRVRYSFVTPASYPGTPVPFPASPSIEMRIETGTQIATTWQAGGGYVEGLGNARMVKYSFDRAMDLQTWVSLTADPALAMEISHTPQVLTQGHIQNGKRRVATGSASWEVIALQ